MPYHIVAPYAQQDRRLFAPLNLSAATSHTSTPFKRNPDANHPGIQLRTAHKPPSPRSVRLKTKPPDRPIQLYTQQELQTPRSIDAIFPQVTPRSVLPVQGLAHFRSEAKEPARTDSLARDDPVMRAVRLCDQSMPVLSDAARKMASAKGHTKLRSEFPVCKHVDPVFAQGLTFLGQFLKLKLLLTCKVAQRLLRGFPLSGRVAGGHCNHPGARLHTQSMSREREIQLFRKREDETGGDRDRDGDLQAARVPFKEWTADVFKKQPEARCDRLRKKLAREDLAKGGPRQQPRVPDAKSISISPAGEEESGN